MEGFKSINMIIHESVRQSGILQNFQDERYLTSESIYPNQYSFPVGDCIIISNLAREGYSVLPRT
jgi:hypothetical protein